MLSEKSSKIMTSKPLDILILSGMIFHIFIDEVVAIVLRQVDIVFQLPLLFTFIGIYTSLFPLLCNSTRGNMVDSGVGRKQSEVGRTLNDANIIIILKQ
jgi:hypothetical protein